jgi:hypothetical protein
MEHAFLDQINQLIGILSDYVLYSNSEYEEIINNEPLKNIVKEVKKTRDALLKRKKDRKDDPDRLQRVIHKCEKEITNYQMRNHLLDYEQGKLSAFLDIMMIINDYYVGDK